VEAKLFDKDNMGLFSEEKDLVPYVGFTITREQKEKLSKNPTVRWYQTDGRQLFEIRDSNGVPTGEFIAFLLFCE
jgi:hypothetical protein